MLMGAITCFYTCIFIVLAFIDLRKRVIPNKIVLPIYLLALFLAPWSDSGLVNSLIGGGIGIVLLSLPKLIGRDIGWGDVKMGGLVGLVTGFPSVFIALLIVAFSGGLVASSLLLTKRRREDTIPYGPFIAFGAIIALIWGDSILRLAKIN
jgi:leader peptidase (prepilin peptidase)/N-methyltransferase